MNSFWTGIIGGAAGGLFLLSCVFLIHYLEPGAPERIGSAALLCARLCAVCLVVLYLSS